MASRRDLLTAGLAAVVTGGAAPPELPAWTQELGGALASPGYGQPSRFEASVVRRVWRPTSIPGVGVSVTPLQDLSGTITPNGLHYERHHAGVPTIDPEAHRLLVHGLVERPLILSMDDLVRMPSVSAIHFLECSGNSQLWHGAPRSATAADTHGMLSCAEWTGVRLADVLDQVGVRPQARWMLAEGADGAAMTRSIPIEKAMDDAILAYAQNGERLRPEQGFPLRLLLPGFEGNTNIKWLRRLKLGTAPWMTREETSKYTDLVPGGRARQFTFVMEVKSVVTTPSGGQLLGDQGSRGLGFREIRGLAWSGRGRISRVEVSLDGGGRWQQASLQQPVRPVALTRFTLPWRWEGSPAVIQSRASDEHGNVQPTHAALLAARPAGYYHYNAIHGWAVASDGTVASAT